MTFNYDYFGLTEPARIYLCKTDNTIICELNGIDLPTVSYTRQLNNFDTIQFDVHKYINGEESNGYDLLDEAMYILVDGVGYFRMQYPQVSNDGFDEYKTVTAQSCECELALKTLKNFKINTGETDSREYLIDGNVKETDEGVKVAVKNIILYDELYKDFSLLDIAIEKVFGWKIGWVDQAIRVTEVIETKVNDDGTVTTASFRKLVAADIPSITKGKITDFPTSLPASDVYAWAKASSKPSYSWSEIGSKPSTFTPSSHNHSYLTLYGGRPANINFSTSTNGTGAMFHFVATSSTKTGKPPEDSNVLQMNWDSNGGWDTQFAISNGSSPHSYIRSQNNGTWGNWTTLLDSSNYNNYSPSKTGSGASGTWGINITGSSGSCTGNAATASNASKVNGHTVNSDVPSGAKFTDTNTWRPLGTAANTACAGNDSRLSNSRPASDVYSWAKASSKPSYSWSEITSKPSTFTPASHTHAYIPLSGGTITGSIIRSSGGSWISARNNVAVRGTATGKDSWNPVVGQATPNGYWTIGNLASNDNLAFSYTSNTNYNAGNNSATTVYLPVQEGTIITSATIGSQSVKYATSAGSAGSVAWGNVSGKPSSYTPSSHTHDDRYYTETEINTKLGAKLGAVSANGYYGMARPDGNTSDWIRTTTAGIIPYQSGGAGGGHCGLGTSSWYFGAAYIDTVNCVNTNASGYLQANGLINTYSEYQSQKGKRDWRFGSATGNGDQNWFGFYDYTSGFHGGWYGPDHIFRAYGELQSTSANSFRSVYGNYGFIIRNDGANIYFMMTKSGDPYGIWNDNYTIFTPNGEWQIKKSPYDNGISSISCRWLTVQSIYLSGYY